MNSSGIKDLSCWRCFWKMFILCGVYKNASRTNKEREDSGARHSNPAFAIKHPPRMRQRLAETSEGSLSCYSRHDILCAAQDIFSHEYKSPAIYYEIFLRLTPHYVYSVKLERDFSDQYTICVESLLAVLAMSCRDTKMEVVLSELNGNRNFCFRQGGRHRTA